MRYDPERHLRRSIRRKGYDYGSSGAYSVTICVHHRLCLFGEVMDGDMHSNAAGWTVERWWRFLPRRFPGIDVDAFVVTPNHMHGIIVIGTDPTFPRASGGDGQGESGGSSPEDGPRPWVGADLRVCPARIRDDAAPRRPTLASVIQWFKTITTTDYVAGVNHMDWPPFERHLWQRGYHDRIVRDEAELNRIRAYIANNPANWHMDDENPAASRQP